MIKMGYIRAFIWGSVVGLAVAIANQANAINYEVLPNAPRSLEAIRLRTTYGGLVMCSDIGFVAMSGNKITVSISCGGGFGSAPPTSFDVELGRFPAGNYSVEVIQQATGQTAYTTAFPVTERHAAPPYDFPVVDYTDHWWNPQESGWGLSIMQHPSDRLFAVWFVYDASNQPVWFTLQPGKWDSPVTYTGPIYKTTGPYFGGPFSPNQVGVTLVGNGMLSFKDYTSGTFSYTVEGMSGNKAITRLPF